MTQSSYWFSSPHYSSLSTAHTSSQAYWSELESHTVWWVGLLSDSWEAAAQLAMLTSLSRHLERWEIYGESWSLSLGMPIHQIHKYIIVNMTTSSLIIPDTRLLSNIMKVFVRTGPGFDNCQTAIPVKVDLIESGTDSMFPTFSHNTLTWFVTICSNYQRTIGFQNSPWELSINRRQITVSTSSGQQHIHAIEMFYLLRGKLTAFLARRGNQDFTDIEHLVMTYPNEIRAFANRLDPEALNFLLTYRPRWGPIFGRWTCWTRSGSTVKETWCRGICLSEYAVSLSTEYHVLLLITFGQFFFLRPLPLSLFSCSASRSDC